MNAGAAAKGKGAADAEQRQRVKELRTAEQRRTLGSRLERRVAPARDLRPAGKDVEVAAEGEGAADGGAAQQRQTSVTELSIGVEAGSRRGRTTALRRRETELRMAEQRSNSRNQALDWGGGRRPAGKDGGAAKELPSHGTTARMEKIQNWEDLFAKCYFYSARDK
ncbi:uncharacterized protein [Triticum aestivum]|uniref:uncharacterized protein isoform X1 n=1 Tax=Triticum aestivum TaxID=4565 RepID=UPI001D011FA6|nr:uncharacterized protein LOC123068821 isoform X1 [Triticum aestivum]XP_044347432.1 uncharacterized protein LOC123068821 isoform X1 [Triticum aestivum]XP_044377146.1 uncharacterized protein LOC123099078 isoform X1 [Triticum aestivum]XP_044377147.1 uncharacterized protein LOC123099078 isoform X1 [Triticum aestivum]XP_044394610.1 uncharacterized protein LOC123119034 isoform X1 [Triticum aestivum]XP_044394611.1 uncharacterized protein LOC123119034 isoform X1 [Triticum aestivum]XP_044394616.1 un